MPADGIKIERTFVCGLEPEAPDPALMAAVLRGLGCPLDQGYPPRWKPGAAGLRAGVRLGRARLTLTARLRAVPSTAAWPAHVVLLVESSTLDPSRRGAGVVERGGLENRCAS